MKSKGKRQFLFRGINVEISNTAPLGRLPDELSTELAEDYEMDRWKPIDELSKTLSNSLPERNREWVRTHNDFIIYGLERWGEMIPNDYREWFAIIVVRPKIITPLSALHAAELSNWLDSHRE